MPTLSTVLLSIKGDARKANLQLDSNGDLSMEIIQKYFKKKDEPECICYYENDNKIIFIFGYKKGKKGTENKTELLDPYSEITLFGDAIVIVSLSHKWENPIPFTVEQWNTFYNSENTCLDEDSEGDDEEADADVDVDVEAEAEAEAEAILSDDDVSVKDEFDDVESDVNLVIDEDEEVEETPAPVKRRRAPAYNKVDTNGLKEEISINSEPESNKLRILCLDGLKFLDYTFSKDDIQSLEHSIFQVAYNYAQTNYVARSWKSPVFIEIYRQIVRSVMSNIHPESPVKNPRLLLRVLDGEFKLAEIANMTAYEMFPEKWFVLKDKLLQREQKILEGNKSRATDQFKCRRCGKRECTYYELQTRSADEPMTIFITCLNCGKEWRNGG
jgi:transcription elongation factor S-II